MPSIIAWRSSGLIAAAASRSAASGPAAVPVRRAASASPARTASIHGASGGPSARSSAKTACARSGRPACISATAE